MGVNGARIARYGVKLSRPIGLRQVVDLLFGFFHGRRRIGRMLWQRLSNRLRGGIIAFQKDCRDW